jgi:hypothetical protein
MNTVLSIMAYILNINRNFLALEPKMGQERWTTLAPQALKKAFESAHQMYQMMVAETDAQEDDVIEAVIEEGRLLAIKIPKTVGMEEKFETELPEEWEKIAQNIVNAIEGKKRASWDEDIVPVLALVVVLLINSGALDQLIDSTISQLPETWQETAKNFLKPGVLTVDFVRGIITSAIWGIELDLKTFFDNPVGFRKLLPAWSSEHNFIMEWECLEEDREEQFLKFVCSSDAKYFDIPHFLKYKDTKLLGTGIDKIEVIERIDGMENPLPYMAFQSPSFNGLIYLSGSYLMDSGDCGTEDEGWVMPNQCEINLFIASTAGGIISLLGGF